MTSPTAVIFANGRVLFANGRVLFDWDLRHLYQQLIPDDALLDAFLPRFGLRGNQAVFID